MLSSFKCAYVDLVDATKAVLFCQYYYDYPRNGCVTDTKLTKTEGVDHC